jgi:BlaI family transcriptional regulator, penicillinase repressor
MGRAELPALSRREREILEIVIVTGNISVPEVRERLSDAPSYSAVRTMLTRLAAKGHVKVRREENRLVYSPTVNREKARKQALRSVLDTFFGGSLAQAVNALLDDRSATISADEARALRRRLREAGGDDA